MRSGVDRTERESGTGPYESQLQPRLDHCSFLATQMCLVFSHATILSEERCTWTLSASGESIFLNATKYYSTITAFVTVFSPLMEFCTFTAPLGLQKLGALTIPNRSTLPGFS